MPVNSTHSEYEAMALDWVRARDVLAGEDAVKAGGEKYLPRIDFQTDAEYAAYRQRASFFNGSARTAEGYAGLIFRRPPFVKIPEPIQAMVRMQSPASLTKNPLVPNSALRTPHSALAGEVAPSSTLGLRPSTFPHPSQPSTLNSQLSAFIADADPLGTSLAAYAKEVTSEVIGVGRAGSLVDWQTDSEQRAYVSLYSAEQIINWRVERVNGRSMPTMIVLRETGARSQRSEVKGQKQAEDPFVEERVEQIRVLKLVDSSSLVGTLSSASQTENPAVPNSALPPPPSVIPSASSFARSPSQPSTINSQPSTTPACLVELWQPIETRKKGAKPEWVLVERRIPLRLGKPLPLIPFVFHGPRHSRPGVDKPPLTDIISVNLDHYRLDADFKHGLHFTALPTAWVSGFDRSSALKIGSSTAWVAESPGATAGFLEFTGQGLTSFERAMDRDERLMAVLGSRLLEDQKRVGETAQAIELRQSGENSILSSIAASVSESLTQVLRWVYWWNSTEALPDEVNESQVLVKLNSDFSLKGMASDELTAVVRAWQAGAISQSTMLELFRKGEILPDGRTNEEEVSLVSPVRSAPGPQNAPGGKTLF